MRKALAYLVYSVGCVLMLGAVISGFADVDEDAGNWAQGIPDPPEAPRR